MGLAFFFFPTTKSRGYCMYLRTQGSKSASIIDPSLPGINFYSKCLTGTMNGTCSNTVPVQSSNINPYLKLTRSSFGLSFGPKAPLYPVPERPQGFPVNKDITDKARNRPVCRRHRRRSNVGGGGGGQQLAAPVITHQFAGVQSLLCKEVPSHQGTRARPRTVTPSRCLCNL